MLTSAFINAGTVAGNRPMAEVHRTYCLADAKSWFVENPAFWGPKSRHGRPPIPKQGAAAAAAGDEAKEEEEAKEGDEAKGEDEVKEGDEAKAGGEKREADAGEEGEGSEEKRQKVA
eukprot:gene5930-33504_t